MIISSEAEKSTLPCIIFTFFSNWKELLSPVLTMLKQTFAGKENCQADGRVPFSASLPAGLTAETAIALTFFLICMISILQFANVYGTSMKIGGAMTQTAEEMAVAAYTSEYFETDSILGVVLTSAYASAGVTSRTGDLSSIRGFNMMFSSVLEEQDMINLVALYQPGNDFGFISIPGIFFLQTARVRGWTGRSGSEGNGSGDSGSESHTLVYVAENGVVYHKDPNCSHIHLHISRVARAALSGLRNEYGETYHSCELCGQNAGSSVFITTDGNRYHSSLSCSGLSRTVHTVSLADIGSLRPCSRCGG